MILSKKQEKELKLVYEAYWDYYLKGDAQAMQYLLDESYTQVGSAKSEVFETKKDAVQFLFDTVGQVAGKLEMRNRSTKMEPQDNVVLIHERCDLYALTDKEWVFYSKFRASTLMQEKKDGWKITHQHSSFPDTKTEEGQNVAIEKIAEENLQLREAVKRRTIELEHKNRELEIEAALERVRARAMAMHNSEELAEAAELLYRQLKGLGLYPWTCGYVFIEEENNAARVWMTEPDGKFFWGSWTVPLSEEKVLKERHESWKKKEKIHRYILKGKENIEHHKYILDFSPTTTDAAEEFFSKLPVYLVFTSVHFSHGYLPIITESVLSNEEENVLIRFAEVFQLTYTRFLDLQKAEAHAREAEIELALERVRSRAMAMQHSDELLEAGSLLYQELLKLGISSLSSGYNIMDADEKIGWNYMSNQLDGTVLPKPMGVPHQETEVMRSITQSWKNQEPLHLNQLDEEATKTHQTFIAERTINFNLSTAELLAITPKHLALQTFNFKQGYLLIVGAVPLSEVQIDMMFRFTKAFQQTYTRFLDLQKAEAQAREAQIEASLERVRSRSMAMHSTSELQEVIETVHKEFNSLDIAITGGVFIAINEDIKKEINCWGAGGTTNYIECVHVPFLNSPIYTGIIKKIQKGPSFFTEEFSNSQKKKFFEHLFKHPPYSNTSKKHKDEIFNREGGYTRSCAVSENTSIFMINHHGVKFSETDNEILSRFAKVFEQTYTRFLDLQKAEAQAREAEIELALERVRARTMAMQKSEDLFVVTEVFHQQAIQFSTNIHNSGFNINYKETDGFNLMMADSFNVGHTEYAHIPYIDNPIYNGLIEAKEMGLDFVAIKLSFEEKNIFWNHFFNYFRPESQEQKKELLAAKGFAISIALLDNVTFYFANYDGTKFSEEENDLVKRFGATFQQAYTRFLDLQKAEDQVREAQIENALEKVRSRTMAMQKSEELPEAANNLFLQVQELGIPAWSAGYCIWESEDKKSTSCNMSSEGELQKSFSFPTIGEGYNFYDPYKRGDTFYVEELGDEKLVKHYEFMRTLPTVGEILDKLINTGLSLPTFQLFHIVYFPQGYLMFITYEPVSESHVIFRRFASVFEQTYTRFLDLQKAEAQAREAQIEAALERVRANAMAMHSSKELVDVATVLYSELKKLGLDQSATCAFVIIDEKNKRQTFWGSRTDSNLLQHFEMPLIGDQILNDRYKAWKKKLPVYYKEVGGKELQDSLEFVMPSASSSEEVNRSKLDMPDPTFFYCGNFAQGYLHILASSLLGEEQEQILSRFAKVFEQTYTRFLDLQNAEAQAREAQVETALEKVRSRTMAMQRSEELTQVADVLFGQILELGTAGLRRCVICIFNNSASSFELWYTSEDGNSNTKSIIIPTTGNDVAKWMTKSWKEKRTDSMVLEEAKIQDFVGFLEHHGWIYPKGEKPAKYMVLSVCPFSHGILMPVTYKQLRKSEFELLQRFAFVFQQTYTRFLDLQNAEAQAREAQIETALERVRSRSMGMQKSDELKEVIQVVYEQFAHLNFQIEHTGFIIDYKTSDNMNIWLADRQEIQTQITLPYFDCAHWNSFKEAKEKGLDFFANHLDFEEKNRFYQDLFKLVQGLSEEAKEYYFSASGLAISTVLLDNIGLYIENFSGIPFSDEENKTLMRFGKVFQQTYTRFLDLQKAEAREKEAIKQSSLDRVRAEIASMRTTDDLDQITPLVWRELTALGVPFFRCGIFIIREKEEMVHAYLSTPSGDQLAALHIGFDETEIGLIQPAIANWRKQEIYSEEWDQERFIQNMGTFMKQGIIESPEKYQDGEKPPEKLALQLVPFLQGMLYVGNSEPLISEHIDLMKDLAKAFSVAYSRYEDFNELEQAKSRIEVTLTDLKSTQNQLVQSEKMASLGELTAGIAHEIQNPLNFVNNFSEVSKELIEEMMEEIQKGDVEEVKALADDIIKNLEKINHHGKRADGIVKGMLQHSRSSSGEKEPTDINALADEYLRLAYHGLRAKDKSFNATMNTDYDDSLEKVNVIPQDIGRVILNLITNAFYVVDEKKKQLKDGYEPTISVSTKKINGKVKINVTDNGNGIPKKVIAKIFQPFFTTKPTGQGTGLGLSLSYDIVKAHGGELAVESKVGEGTAFTIALPV